MCEGEIHMKCSNCNADLAANVKFCPECGAKVNAEQKTVLLKCKVCGGTLRVDANKSVLVCPFCQSTELLVESDDVTIQRIKSETYKEVELEKLKHEEKMEDRKEEKAQKAEEAKKAYTGKFGKLAIFCLICALFCAISAFGFFRNSPGQLLNGIQAASQAVVFFLAWIWGRKNALGKTSTRHKLMAILGVLLFGFFSMFTQNTSLLSGFVVQIPSISETTVTNENEGIYCYPVRNYLSRNAASIGKKGTYYRIDEYGEADLRIVFVAENGIYIDPRNEEQLKEYVVYAQSLPADSTLIAVTGRWSSGEPTSTIDYMSQEEILLYVHPVGAEAPAAPEITTLNFSTDRRTYYVRNYVGRNAASIGPKSNYKKVDEYGHGEVKINFTTEDGTYIDAKDVATLRQYVVVAQDIAPNTMITYTFSKWSSGEETDTVDYQNYTEINLTVRKLDDSVIAQMPEITPTPEPEPTPVVVKLSLDYEMS